MKAHKRETSPEPQASGGIIGPIVNGLLDLPLGGGLCMWLGVADLRSRHQANIRAVNGVLQPLSGALQPVDLPTPQPQGLKEIPGDDPDHQFQAPAPTDERVISPQLNT